MNATRLFLLTTLSYVVTYASAQRLSDPDGPQCPDGPGPVRSTTLYSDSACTSFLLCIDKAVRPHLHRTHTEHVFVLDGSAEMLLGDSTFNVKPGDALLIPAGTPHAVKVKSGGPLQVISVQSPFFDGTDRVWLDEQ